MKKANRKVAAFRASREFAGYFKPLTGDGYGTEGTKNFPALQVPWKSAAIANGYRMSTHPFI